jgi:hypothetical protein
MKKIRRKKCSKIWIFLFIYTIGSFKEIYFERCQLYYTQHKCSFSCLHFFVLQIPDFIYNGPYKRKGPFRTGVHTAVQFFSSNWAGRDSSGLRSFEWVYSPRDTISDSFFLSDPTLGLCLCVWWTLERRRASVRALFERGNHVLDMYVSKRQSQKKEKEKKCMFQNVCSRSVCAVRPSRA